MPTLYELFKDDQADRQPGYMPTEDRDKARREKVVEEMATKINPTKDDYYYAAAIFNHGSGPDVLAKAHEYAQSAYNLARQQNNFEVKDMLPGGIAWLVAATYDRWQVEKQFKAKKDGNDPFQHLQRYGTQRMPPDSALFPSVSRDAINQERKKLGIESLEDEEKRYGIKSPEPAKAPIIGCNLCGASNHSSDDCSNTSTYKRKK